MIAPHDPAGRGLLNADNAGGVGSGEPLLVDEPDQLNSHLGHGGRTSRVYLLYFIVVETEDMFRIRRVLKIL